MSNDRWTDGPMTRGSRGDDGTADSHWERDALREIALEGVRERRLARRWGIFFKLLFFGYLVALLVLASGYELGLARDTAPREHTAVVRVNGLLLPDGNNRAELIIGSLQQAFRDAGTRAVVLHINSPGGSAVQAGQINDEVRRLRQAYPDIPVYAVADDMFTSGAYYLAVSADRIFVDRSTLIGSIGVIAQGFGLSEALEKLGIERRVYTAGENKALLDPFSPEREEDVQWIQGLLDEVHQQFIDAVIEGRGERLAADHETLFSGLIWTGQQGVELGLADEIGSLHYVAREVVGAEYLKDFTVRPGLLQRLGGRIAADVVERLLLSRFIGPALP